MGCSAGGLSVGSAAAGVRCCGEGVPALPDQLCGDGFCGDPAAEASLGPLTRCQNLRTTASTYVLARSMSVDRASGVSTPKTDPVFLYVRAGTTVIVEDRKAWRMAEVIWVDGGARNPKVPTLFQVADVDTGVTNWVNADLVTHIVPSV